MSKFTYLIHDKSSTVQLTIGVMHTAESLPYARHISLLSDCKIELNIACYFAVLTWWEPSVLLSLESSHDDSHMFMLSLLFIQKLFNHSSTALFLSLLLTLWLQRNVSSRVQFKYAGTIVIRVITIPIMHRSAQAFWFRFRCIMGSDGNYDTEIAVAIAIS